MFVYFFLNLCNIFSRWACDTSPCKPSAAYPRSSRRPTNSSTITLVRQKYYGVEIGFNINDTGKCVELVAFPHLEIYLVRKICSNGRRLNFKVLDVTHIFLRQLRYAPGHRSREKQQTAVLVGIGYYTVHIVYETEIEHLVRLVEYKVTQFERSSVPRFKWSRIRPGVPTTMSTPF